MLAKVDRDSEEDLLVSCDVRARSVDTSSSHILPCTRYLSGMCDISQM